LVKKNKANPRVNIGGYNEMILYDQVDGICPLCAEPLLYEKSKKEKVFEIAHIYPLNPKPTEVALLKNEEILSTDLNHIDNLILLCPTCHTKFDKPRTVEEYRELVALKKKMIQKNNIYGEFNSYKIEEEIHEVLELLTSGLSVGLEENKLSYDALKVSKKADDTLDSLTLRDIETDVLNYYITIKHKFVDINKTKSGSFDKLSLQVKHFYENLKLTGVSQEDLYDGVIEWLNHKTNNHSRRACRIIASFFVQNCEVLS
jgi:uncharacterized protein YbaR (Trm112 family)